MKVYIITYCTSPESLYGNLLTLGSIRTGFPGAEIIVVHNSVAKECRSQLAEAAEKVGAASRYVENVSHASIILQIMSSHYADEDSIVILDPDIIFWEDCSGWDFGGKLAGRLLPRFFDEYSGCDTVERIHTSFLWVDNPRRLVNSLIAPAKKHFELKLVEPFMFRLDGKMLRYDTLAGLYHFLPSAMSPFTEEHLDCYDHIFCGTHKAAIKDTFSELTKVHEAVKKGNLGSLRGIWREQQRFFVGQGDCNEPR